MDTSFVIAVALGVAVVVVLLLLVLVAVIVFQRWRISDNNAHLKSFLNENMEMRDKLRRYEGL